MNALLDNDLGRPELRLHRLPAAAGASSPPRPWSTRATSRRTWPPRSSGRATSRSGSRCCSCRPRPTPSTTGSGRSSRPVAERDARSGPPGTRYLWPLLALPGAVWLAVLFVAPLYVVLAILFGGVDPILRQPVPVWNPLDWDFTELGLRLGAHRRAGPVLPARAGAHGGLRRRREPALPADRLPGRLLHGPVRRPVEGPAAGGADRAVLDQLHDADAGLGQPAPDRRAGQPGAQRRRPDRRARGLAQRARDHRGARAGLRLRALHDPAAVRRPRPGPDRDARGRARPGGQPVADVPPGHLAAEPGRGGGEPAAHDAADAGRLLHLRPALRVAVHVDGRQPDQQHRAHAGPDRSGRGVRAADPGRLGGADARSTCAAPGHGAEVAT